MMRQPRPRIVSKILRVGTALCGHAPILIVLGLWLRKILLVSIEIVEEEVVILDSVLQVIHDFLFLVYFDAEATSLIKDVLVIVQVVVGFTGQATSSRQYELSFRLKRVLHASLAHAVLL